MYHEIHYAEACSLSKQSLLLGFRYGKFFLVLALVSLTILGSTLDDAIGQEEPLATVDSDGIWEFIPKDADLVVAIANWSSLSDRLGPNLRKLDGIAGTFLGGNFKLIFQPTLSKPIAVVARLKGENPYFGITFEIRDPKSLLDFWEIPIESVADGRVADAPIGRKFSLQGNRIFIDLGFIPLVKPVAEADADSWPLDLKEDLASSDLVMVVNLKNLEIDLGKIFEEQLRSAGGRRTPDLMTSEEAESIEAWQAALSEATYFSLGVEVNSTIESRLGLKFAGENSRELLGRLSNDESIDTIEAWSAPDQTQVARLSWEFGVERNSPVSQLLLADLLEHWIPSLDAVESRTADFTPTELSQLFMERSNSIQVELFQLPLNSREGRRMAAVVSSTTEDADQFIEDMSEVMNWSELGSSEATPLPEDQVEKLLEDLRGRDEVRAQQATRCLRVVAHRLTDELEALAGSADGRVSELAKQILEDARDAALVTDRTDLMGRYRFEPEVEMRGGQPIGILTFTPFRKLSWSESLRSTFGRGWEKIRVRSEGERVGFYLGTSSRWTDRVLGLSDSVGTDELVHDDAPTTDSFAERRRQSREESRVNAARAFFGRFENNPEVRAELSLRGIANRTAPSTGSDSLLAVSVEPDSLRLVFSVPEEETVVFSDLPINYMHYVTQMVSIFMESYFGSPAGVEF